MEELIFPNNLLLDLWQRANRESADGQSLDNWAGEVGDWANLAIFCQQLQGSLNLWLPTSEPQELNVLLGLELLARSLDTTPAQLAKKLLSLTPDITVESARQEPAKENVNKLSSKHIDTTALLQMVDDWQTTFESAIDQAGQQLTTDEFPAQALSSYLNDMCKLLRKFFTTAFN